MKDFYLTCSKIIIFYHPYVKNAKMFVKIDMCQAQTMLIGMKVVERFTQVKIIGYYIKES